MVPTPVVQAPPALIEYVHDVAPAPRDTVTVPLFVGLLGKDTPGLAGTTVSTISSEALFVVPESFPTESVLRTLMTSVA